MASGFDERDQTKLEFLNMYHTFKNFCVNAKKTEHDDLLGYLKLIREILEYVQSPQFAQFFANFDRKIRKNVVKRCVVQPLTKRILAPPIIIYQPIIVR